MKNFNLKFILALITLLSISYISTTKVLPVGIFFDEENGLNNEYNINLINKLIKRGQLNKLKIKSLYVNIEDQKNITGTLCSQYSNETIGIIVQAPIKRRFRSFLSIMSSIFQDKNTPLIYFDDQSSSLTSSLPLSFKPDMSQFLIELIKSYKKPYIYYIYNHADGFYLVENILKYHRENINSIDDIIIRKLNFISDSIDMLKFIRESANYTLKNQIKIFVDLDTIENFNKFMSNVKYLGLDRPPFEFVLMSTEVHELDLDSFFYTNSSIIGFSLIDYTNIDTIKLQSDLFSTGEPLNNIKSIPIDSAYLIDSLLYLNENSIELNGRVNKNKELNCYSNDFNIKLNKNILDNILVKTNLKTLKGLTGPLSFNTNGKRTNFRITINKIDINMQLKNIGIYESNSNRIEYTNNDVIQTDTRELSNKIVKKRRKIKIVSILYDKFLYERNSTDDEKYDGYCADLAKHLAEAIDVDYQLVLVKDGKFGIRDSNGNWSGVVGELIRHEADIAIAPLTITKERRKSIQFSQPFLDGHLSIVMKKPKQIIKINEFNFLNLFDVKIWFYIIGFTITVSVLLSIIGQFSPYEKEKNKALKQFTIVNSFWFSFGSLTKQRVNIFPKSTSGRILAIFWWSFSILILIIYASNVTSFLFFQNNDFESMKSMVEMTTDKLSSQTDVKYGIIEGGSTHQFFKNNKNEIYKKMWQQMSLWGSSVLVKDISNGVRKMGENHGKYALIMEMFSNVPVTSGQFECSLIKVGNNIRSVSYGVATYYGSDLINSINTGLMRLRENGYLDKLKKKWLNVECKNNNNKNNQQTQANQLRYFREMSLILMIALGLGILFSIFEFIFRKVVFKN